MDELILVKGYITILLVSVSKASKNKSPQWSAAGVNLISLVTYGRKKESLSVPHSDCRLREGMNFGILN
jgi:hypothetical protein